MSSTESRKTPFLVAVILAIMVVFVGAANAYMSGVVKSQSYTLLTQSTQILTALKNYKEKEGSLPSHLSELVKEGFLVEMPNPQAISFTPYALQAPEGKIFVSGMSEDVCLATHEIAQENEFSVQAKCIETAIPDHKGMMLVFEAL